MAFNSDEKSALVDLLDSGESRNLAAAVASDSIREEKSYDLCSMLATMFWTYATLLLKHTKINLKQSKTLPKYAAEYPLIVGAITKIAKAVPKVFGTSLSEYAETRLSQRETLTSLFFFNVKFRNFMARRSPDFTEKLR